jgi:hypothetical protein
MISRMSPATQTIYVNRLQTLSWKIWKHMEWAREKLWAHHSTNEYQERCSVCFRYSCLFAKWDRKWWEIRKIIQKKEKS